MQIRLINIVFLVLLLLITHTGFGQLKFVPDEDIPLQFLGTTLKNPWAGGFNSPQFSMIDLNNDGWKDLVSFERGYFGVFKAFMNDGQAGMSEYTYAPEFLNKFPHLQNWALLVDYNCDGHEDIFSSVPGGIRIYRNDFTEENGNHFTLVTPILIAEGLDGQEPVYVSPPDLPAIHDVDGDGDLDILSFEVLGNHVAYFKNMSMENYGNCDHLEYELKNNCWGYFSEDATNNTINLYDTCEMNVTDPEKSGKHAGSTLLAYDHNGDGVTDLALGDISYNTMTLLTNGGTVNSSIMVAATYNFPETDPINMTVFPAAYRQDVNNDGLKDLLVSPNNPNTSINHNNTWYFENEGTVSQPLYYFVQDDFLQGTMIDVGAGAFTCFYDEDGDGLTDLLIGNYGYFVEAGNYKTQVALLRNTGTADEPAFTYEEDDYMNLSLMGFNGFYPAVGDMDGDGDKDMIAGDEDGLLHYFRNEGGAGNPAQFVLSQANYKGIDVGQSAKPQIMDVNRDGKSDLLVGERSGTVNYFENSGTTEDPDFAATPTNDFFGGIDVMPECCTGFSAPFMVEDSLGNYMLYVGSEQGKLYLFNNIEENIAGTFNLVDSLYLYGMNVAPAMSDLDNDGRLEMAAGEYAGGVSMWKFGKPQGLGYNEPQAAHRLLRVYPNPARDYIELSIENLKPGESLQVKIMDTHGRATTAEITLRTDTKIRLDVSGLIPGIYIARLATGSGNYTGKFIISD